MSRIFPKSVLLGLVGLILVVAIAVVLGQPPKLHASAEEAIGRYQISSWASYAGERAHHSGYYIIDTVTGKVVDRGHEIHGIESATQN